MPPMNHDCHPPTYAPMLSPLHSPIHSPLLHMTDPLRFFFLNYLSLFSIDGCHYCNNCNNSEDNDVNQKDIFETYLVERTNKWTTEACKEVTYESVKFDRVNVPEQLKTRFSGP